MVRVYVLLLLGLFFLGCYKSAMLSSEEENSTDSSEGEEKNTHSRDPERSPTHGDLDVDSDVDSGNDSDSDSDVEWNPDTDYHDEDTEWTFEASITCLGSNLMGRPARGVCRLEQNCDSGTLTDLETAMNLLMSESLSILEGMGIKECDVNYTCRISENLCAEFNNNRWGVLLSQSFSSNGGVIQGGFACQDSPCDENTSLPPYGCPNGGYCCAQSKDAAQDAEAYTTP